jgi:hypothetical protein
MSNLFKKTLWASALVLLIVLVKVFFLQYGHFAKGEQYLQDSDWKLAMREYDLAMHMYTPLSPYIEKSAERLWQIGEMFEQQGKPRWALTAYSSIRSSFFASRSFFTPGKKWIRKCNERISSLNASILQDEGIISPWEFDTERRKFLYVLSVKQEPSVPWSLIALAGFLGWTGAIVSLIYRRKQEKGTTSKMAYFLNLAVLVVSVGAWVVGLVRA